MRSPTPATGAPRRHRLLATGVACLLGALAYAPTTPAAHADDNAGPKPRVIQTNLVANNDEYGAQIVDPSLVNAWGMSKFPTSPVWVSNNHDDSSTLYTGGSAANPSGVAKVPRRVTVDGGPTGQVANTSAGFLLPNGSKALFIFASEDGELYAWNLAAGTTSVETADVDDANFKGLALGTVGTDAFLYAADFANGAIQVFDSTWTHVTWPGTFQVPHLPHGLAPFNVQVLQDNGGMQHVFVAYALRDPVTNDEIAGKNLGLVGEFTTDGTFVRTFARQGMNAPWGLAYAPAGWGSASGKLLVGQFGNGRIEIYDPHSGKHRGSVRDAHGKTLVIDGLWALMAGDATSGGTGSILFTAGPDDENDGLYGVLTPSMGHGH